jgi:hypothetical protein
MLVAGMLRQSRAASRLEECLAAHDALDVLGRFVLGLCVSDALSQKISMQGSECSMPPTSLKVPESSPHLNAVYIDRSTRKGDK